MPFKLNAYLPSKQAEVQIKELYYKQYRELVKSLYNVDKKETIQQYNSILEDLCPDIIEMDITFEDKLSLLLTVRNYCISPDLKLKSTLPNGSTFNHSFVVEELIKKVKSINKSGTVQYDNIIVSYSSYKIRDEQVFFSNNNDTFVKLASYIDTIKIEEQLVIFKDLTIDERLSIVHALPYKITLDLTNDIAELEDKYSKIDFIVLNSPVTKEVVYSIDCNLAFPNLQKIIEFLFTENLNNVYRAFYNMVKFAGFNANYVDSITPVELQVYWMYFMQDQQKADEAKANTSNTSGANMPVTRNTELGF
jgi:hypothetical protein